MAIVDSLAHSAASMNYAIILCLATCLYIFCIVVYRLYLHPLAKFPGPLLGKLTSWYATWASLQGESTRTRHRCLEKYGKVARIGPNELVFGDMQSIKDIYGQSSNPCLKDDAFYDGFSITGTYNVFNTCDRAEHARIRRLQSHGFSLASLLKSEDRVAAIVERFLTIIENAPQPVDLLSHSRALFFDIVSELSFDRCWDCLSGARLREALDVDAFINVTALKGMLPWIEWLPTKFIQDSVRARPRLVELARGCIDEFRERVAVEERKSSGAAADDASLLRRMFDARDAQTGTAFSDRELMENALIFLQAGTGTSLATALYFVYEVDRHPAVRARLVDEIRAACPGVGCFPRFEELDRLPYLNMVFDEVLRLRGPLPSNLPRRSPGKVIGGHYVPRGTLVANLGWTTHRDPDVFADPLAFKPERWESPTVEMKAMFRPFSTGPRNCIGMHLAKVQVLLMLGALYQRFDVGMDSSMTEENMVESDRGVLQPSAEKVFVHVTPRKKT